MGDKTIEMPALGRPFTLGSLYDQTSGTLLAQKPWKEVTLEESKLQVTPLPGTKFEVELSNTIKERTTNLSVSAELSLDLAGSINIKGSAAYASKSKSAAHKSSVAFVSKRTTETKSLTQTQLGPDGLDYPTVLDNKEATHFVSSITYGQNAVMVFESERKDEETLMDVVGKLSVNIQDGMVKGSGELQLTNTEKNLTEDLKCKFYGDYSDISPPLNFDQARGLILTLTEDGHGEPIPISVTLTPVNQLGNAAMKIVREMSSTAVIKAGSMLQDLEDIQVELATLKGSKTAAEFPKFKDTINKMSILYNNEGISFKKELSQILPEIKGTGTEEQALFDIIHKYQASVFRKPLLVEWAQKIKNETSTIDYIIEDCHAKSIKIATSGAEFRQATITASKGLLYLEAKLRSRLDPEVVRVLEDNQNGIVELPTQAEEAVKVFWDGEDKFIHHFSRYKNHVLKLKQDEAEYETILFLDYMSSNNEATVQLQENGMPIFTRIKLEARNNSRISNLRHVKETNTITGQLAEVVPGNERVKIQIKIKPTNKPDDQQKDAEGEGEDKDDYKIQQLFDVDGFMFEVNLAEMWPKLREGLDYLARVRWYLRPGLAGDWEDDISFKAWEYPQIQLPSTRVLEVGVPAKIECLILAGYPEPTVEWTKSGNIVDSDHKTDLVFENPTKDTKGTYTVEVSNGVGEPLKHSVLVTVAETTEDFEQIIRRKIDEDVEPRFSDVDKHIQDIKKDVEGNDRQLQAVKQDTERVDRSLREAGQRKAAFSVSGLTDQTSDLKFGDVKVDNEGAFSTTTGVYRIPYEGTYFFTWSLTVGHNSHTDVKLYVDGSGRSAVTGIRTGDDWDTMTGSVVLQLREGQQVTIRKTYGKLDSAGGRHSFSGFLIA